jgi:hypothetical protein
VTITGVDAMEHANRKHWTGAALAVTVLVLLMQGNGSRATHTMSHAAGTAPCTVLAVPALQLAGMRLSLRIECDTPSGCALARGLWPVVATFTSGNGE